MSIRVQTSLSSVLRRFDTKFEFKLAVCLVYFPYEVHYSRSEKTQFDFVQTGFLQLLSSTEKVSMFRSYGFSGWMSRHRCGVLKVTTKYRSISRALWQTNPIGKVWVQKIIHGTRLIRNTPFFPWPPARWARERVWEIKWKTATGKTWRTQVLNTDRKKGNIDQSKYFIYLRLRPHRHDFDSQKLMNWHPIIHFLTRCFLLWKKTQISTKEMKEDQMRERTEETQHSIAS